MRALPFDVRQIWVETQTIPELGTDRFVVRYASLTGEDIALWRVIAWWDISEVATPLDENGIEEVA